MEQSNHQVDAETRYANVHRWAEVDWYTPREQLAIEYAERFAQDHKSLDDAFFARLRQEFADGEVMDLMVCVSSFLALGRLTQVLDVAPDCPLEL